MPVKSPRWCLSPPCVVCHAYELLKSRDVGTTHEAARTLNFSGLMYVSWSETFVAWNCCMLYVPPTGFFFLLGDVASAANWNFFPDWCHWPGYLILSAGDLNVCSPTYAHICSHLTSGACGSFVKEVPIQIIANRNFCSLACLLLLVNTIACAKCKPP